MPKDILINPDGSPVIKNGDFVIGDSTEQHQRSLLKMHPGENKRFPMVGVGLSTFLESDDLELLPRVVTSELEQDGMEVQVCEVSEEGKLTLQAGYVD